MELVLSIINMINVNYTWKGLSSLNKIVYCDRHFLSLNECFEA